MFVRAYLQLWTGSKRYEFMIFLLTFRYVETGTVLRPTCHKDLQNIFTNYKLWFTSVRSKGPTKGANTQKTWILRTETDLQLTTSSSFASFPVRIAPWVPHDYDMDRYLLTCLRVPHDYDMDRYLLTCRRVPRDYDMDRYLLTCLPSLSRLWHKRREIMAVLFPHYLVKWTLQGNNDITPPLSLSLHTHTQAGPAGCPHALDEHLASQREWLVAGRGGRGWDLNNGHGTICSPTRAKLCVHQKQSLSAPFLLLWHSSFSRYCDASLKCPVVRAYTITLYVTKYFPGLTQRLLCLII